MTKVSTITPCYRMGDYINGFLENLKTQTHKDLEVIIDHNNPSQVEIDLISKYNEEFGNITHIQVDGVDPIGVSMNRCIEYAEGDYLCIWNVDDLRTSDSIEVMAKTLDDNPDIDFVYGNYYQVSQFGSTQGFLIDETGKEEWLTKGMILGPFFMFRKSILNKSGLFDEQLVSGADFDLALRLAFNGKGMHISNVLGYYLNEGKGASTRPDSKQGLERTVIELRYGLNVLEPHLISTAKKYDIEHIVFNDEQHLAINYKHHNLNNKYIKESYLQPDPSNLYSEFWETNITGVLLREYQSYMKGKVAEFGCNHGVCVAKVSLLESVDEVVGFDINHEAIVIANSDVIMNQIPLTKNKVKYVETNLTDISWEENYFDFAFSIHTVEHIYPEDIDKSITEMAKVLKKNAYFLVNLPDKNSYYWEPLHVYRPNIEELNSLFEKHGFKTIESYLDQRGGQVGESTNITALYQKL